MLVTLGRMPPAVDALGGVDQGGGVFDVSLPVAAMVRALGGGAAATAGEVRVTSTGDTRVTSTGDVRVTA